VQGKQLSKIKRLTFKTLQEGVSWEDMAAMWMEAESIEDLDGGYLFDHFYPMYGASEDSCFESWTALSCLAGMTKRLRLGLLVSANPYRHPAVLANMAATFDVFSGGRLELGIGAGWYKKETDAYGIDLPPLKERFDRLEEACEVIDLLLTNRVSNFDGIYYQLVQARCEPKPIQKPRPSIIIGGKGETRTLKIAARYADDWNFPGGTAEELAHKINVLHQHCKNINRNPAEITISAQVRIEPDLRKTLAKARSFTEAGAQHLCLYFYDCSRPSMIRKAVQAIGELN
jgi:F420-dependent oxidoreductase-like protein